MEVKQKIIELLKGTNRNGIDALIKQLEGTGFFECPASTKFHGCFKGGLAEHSLGVYGLLLEYNNKFSLGSVSAFGQEPLEIKPENIIIATLLHDVCKVGAYIGDQKPYTYNRSHPKGHALLSIERIKRHIKLTELEELMIKYHMGVYGLNEFEEKSGEYPLRGDDSLPKEERRGKSLANAWYHNPIVKVMYFCDELETLSSKTNEISTTLQQ